MEATYVSATTLRRVAGNFATGVTVITTTVDGQPQGCAANAVASLSLDPPLMLVCLAHTSKTRSHLLRARVFAINIMDDSPTSRDLCRAFARRSTDKFVNVEFRSGGLGVPILASAVGWMECELAHTYDCGDHTILVGRVLGAADCERAPLIFFRGGFGSLTFDSEIR
jgi:flavin reductase (DIM6/NTAB) family NADH-FMN oxidoreductase RutF